jgi:hypothetical protein
MKCKADEKSAAGSEAEMTYSVYGTEHEGDSGGKTQLRCDRYWMCALII